MKTITTPILSAIIAVIILFSTAEHSKAADSLDVVTLTSIKSISKIRVSGNVELVINQSDEENVTIFDAYYAKTALVQMEEGELRISAFGQEKMKIQVNVIELTSLVAGNQVKVSTLNQISSPSLSIELSDAAEANIQVNSLDLNTLINRNASLTLSGDTGNFSAEINGTGKLDGTKFKAQSESVTVSEQGQALTVKNGKNVVVTAKA